MTNCEYSRTAIKVQAKARVAAAVQWRTALHHHVSRQYAPDAGENQTQTQQRVCVRSAGWDEINKFQENFRYEWNVRKQTN